ncbi:hypothetical protein [Streptomyces sp. NPDC000983]|uniref:hypothetical protein n=1 Tax=Streptomyces sp. NPDC000983 TaxID=3154373 RepID=UPI00332AEE2E
MKQLKRALITIGMMGAASAAAITMSAATAAAAPAGYVNEYRQTFYDRPGDGTVAGGYATAWNLCRQAAIGSNMLRYNDINGANGEYYYCANGSNGGVNLWWRHLV